MWLWKPHLQADLCSPVEMGHPTAALTVAWLAGPWLQPWLSVPSDDSRHCHCAGSCPQQLPEQGRAKPGVAAHLRAASPAAPHALHCLLRANGCHGMAPLGLPVLLLRGALRTERNLPPIFFGQEWAQTSPITIAIQYYAFILCLSLLMKCSWHWLEACEPGL